MDIKENKIDEEYKYYSKLYYEKFGKRAFIAEPNGSKAKTIDAIKKSLEANEDLLGKIFYPELEDKNILY